MNIFLAIFGILFLALGFYSLNTSQSSWQMLLSLLLGIAGVIAGTSIVSLVLVALQPTTIDPQYIIIGVQLILAFVLWSYFSRVNNQRQPHHHLK